MQLKYWPWPWPARYCSNINFLISQINMFGTGTSFKVSELPRGRTTLFLFLSSENYWVHKVAALGHHRPFVLTPESGKDPSHHSFFMIIYNILGTVFGWELLSSTWGEERRGRQQWNNPSKWANIVLPMCVYTYLGEWGVPKICTLDPWGKTQLLCVCKFHELENHREDNSWHKLV